jgi:hypothetical protein
MRGPARRVGGAGRDALARGNQQSKVQLDWATVSYRSIWRAVVYLLLLVALGGLFFYLKASLRTSPEDLADREIERATRLHEEASHAVGEDAGLRRTAARAARLLDSAREARDRAEFVGARAAAEQSIALSRKILDGNTSDAFAANIFKYEGDVKVKRARQFLWNGISGNTSLSVGDQVKTASNGSAQILYFDGTITTVKPGSLVEIRELSEDPKTKVRKIREQVNWGAVSAATSGANVDGSFHEVATETATARAHHKAEFNVAFDAETKHTRTEVHGGQAEVSAAGRTMTLNPLERLEVSEQEVVTRKLPSAPQLVEPPDSRVYFLGGQESPVASLHWSRVDRAERYRLQISRTPLFADRLLDKGDIRSTRVQIPGLSKGTYYWRVAAVENKELESPFSESRRFRVEGERGSAGSDREPPPLTLDEFLPTGHLVIINGRTEPGTAVTIAGQAIDVYDDGAFTAVIRMKKEGRNDLEIIAHDPSGNETRMSRAVFVESY